MPAHAGTHDARREGAQTRTHSGIHARNPTTTETHQHTQVNIATGLSTRVTMHQCRGCLKYMGGSGGSGWGHYEHESRELMAVCLKKVNGLNRLRLIDAQWIWTEPHSKR